MKTTPLNIPEVLLLTPVQHRDERGFFSEVFTVRRMAEAGIAATFVQENHSLSRQKGVVRGLHFQTDPHAQGKLVRVVKGSIFDVAVDLRTGSPTYGRHVSAVLSADNWTSIWVPPGFAHGFCTLEPDTEVIYKVTAYYAPECDKGLKWDDPALAIDWPVERDTAILSPKDLAQPLLSELPPYFTAS
ncbi:MAG: dTDP-4-dehydrorhamnose 3,5-epimerase [Hyphomicrobiaceae bacterium]|nr:dTDP-4-dehydrorhamnose 3,5-epimerase [Hyphomicrobiaceae bacterium]